MSTRGSPSHDGGRRRHPMRRLSSIGRTTTGWRSTLETKPDAPLGTFIGGALVAGGIVALLMFLAAFFGNR